MWAEDRTHRQVIELAEFIQRCREHSVRVATAGTEYDLSDPDQVSMWFIKMRFAEAEVEKLSPPHEAANPASRREGVAASNGEARLR
jgi:DNA invertase Pin-like site-specific DNA recombinase